MKFPDSRSSGAWSDIPKTLGLKRRMVSTKRRIIIFSCLVNAPFLIAMLSKIYFWVACKVASTSIFWLKIILPETFFPMLDNNRSLLARPLVSKTASRVRQGSFPGVGSASFQVCVRIFYADAFADVRLGRRACSMCSVRISCASYLLWTEEERTSHNTMNDSKLTTIVSTIYYWNTRGAITSIFKKRYATLPFPMASHTTWMCPPAIKKRCHSLATIFVKSRVLFLNPKRTMRI